jgi:hypothetical protein
MREPVEDAHAVDESRERGDEQTSSDELLEALKEVEKAFETTVSGEGTISRDTAA